MTVVSLDQDTLKRAIRDVPNFPKPGILFRDITPLLQNGPMFQRVIDEFVSRYQDKKVDAVVAIESRGLIFGSALAYRLGVGLVPVRKAGKLPHKTLQATYALEYGEGILEIHVDGLSKGHRVVLIDDLLATGGTMAAVVDLMERLGASVLETAFVVELTALKGRAKLGKHPICSLVQY